MKGCRGWLACAVLFVSLGLAMAQVVPPEKVQPTTEDWTALQQKAATAHDVWSRLINNFKRQLDAYNNEKPEKGSPEESMLSQLTQRHQRSVAALQEVDNLLLKLNDMPAAERTRAQYLTLRRQIKRLVYQETIERQYRYSIYESQPERIDSRIPLQPESTLPIGTRPQGVSFDWQHFPRIDGSTTAQPLAALIACRMLGLAGEWRERKLQDYRNADGTTERILIPACAEPPKADLTGYFESNNGGVPGLRVSVELSGTPNAYKNLINRACDVIIVARPPSPDEGALAKKQGVELVQVPIAYDAFLFLLNTDNPLNSLTVKQIQDIYQDNVLRWCEFGGKNANVIAYQRERNSGSQETMEALVMKGLTIAPADQMLIGYGMGGPYLQLPGNPNGIGYTFYYYHTYQSPYRPKPVPANAQPWQKPRLKICAVNGITPTPETIRNRTYPFVTEVYAVVRKDSPADSAAVRLRDWLLTPEGQALVKESGYVPLPEK